MDFIVNLRVKFAQFDYIKIKMHKANASSVLLARIKLSKDKVLALTVLLAGQATMNGH